MALAVALFMHKSSLILLLILCSRASSTLVECLDLHRSDFPRDFVFGASSSAYQYEGAAAEDGKGPSIWDTFTHEGNMVDGSTGDVALDEYHRYKEDVKLMYEMGLDAYRFSISWPRLIPEGRGAINPKGVEYYNSLINELLDHGIRPYITLHHFDLPKSLEDSYGGWVNPQIVEDYLAFADICFREFGDRVKNWITFNEPNIFASLGYDRGIIAPKRCSIPAGRCKTGNSTIEPYLAGHYMLLSHAAAVKLYRDKYQAKQKGSIGLIILSQWYRSLTNTIQDITATQRMTDFEIGWFLDPLIYGDYPKVMRQIVGSRLPLLTEKQSREIRQSFDFIGLNHYSTNYVEDAPAAHANNYERDYFTDLSVRVTVERDGIPIGQMSKIKGFGSVPWGFQELLEYIRQHYGNPPVVVTECGYPDLSNDSIPVAEALNDTNRINYYHDYLQYMLAAIRNGSNTRGFFVWTLLDDFEYVMGYTARFGLHYVDFSDNLKRYPKLSVRGFKRMLLPKTNLLVL
jgi:beta-glucosidase